MSYLNRQEIIGNVGSAPEMRFTPNGKPVTSFRVATNRYYQGKDGERKQEATWFSVVCFGKTAEICNQHVTKGMRLYVEGSTKLASWQGNDGQNHSKLELLARQVIFLDKKKSDAATEAPEYVDEGPDEAAFE